MTINEYWEVNSLLQVMSVINDAGFILPDITGVIGFESQDHLDSVLSEIEEYTDKSGIRALFAATGHNFLELVPFSLIDDLCMHPAAIKDAEGMYFEIGRLYFHGILVY